MSLLPIMMWLNISFSPSEHYALGTASSRKRKAARGPDSMTGQRSAEVQNLSHPIAGYAGPQQAGVAGGGMYGAAAVVEDHRRTAHADCSVVGGALNRGRRRDGSRLRFVQPVPGYRLDVDVGLVAPGLCKVVSHLQPQPRFRAAAECFVETDRHIGRNAALAVDQIIQGLPRYPQCLGSLGDCQPQRFDAVMPHRKAGVGWIFHRHRGAFLVVIEQIDVRGVTLLEAKDNPPVGADGDAPITSRVTLYGCSRKPGKSSCSGRVASSSLAKMRAILSA